MSKGGGKEGRKTLRKQAQITASQAACYTDMQTELTEAELRPESNTHAGTHWPGLEDGAMAKHTTHIELEDDNVDAALNPLCSADPPTAATTTITNTNSNSSSNINEFTSRKKAAHSVMDAALFMANISQLRMLFTDGGATTRFFVPLLCLVVFSILCQILFALLILVIWARETRQCRLAQGDPRPRSSDRQQGPSTTSRSQPSSGDLTDGRQGISFRTSAHENGLETSPQPVPSPPPSSPLLNGHMTSFDMSEDPLPVTSPGGDAKFDVITRRLHIVTLMLVFLITIANMFITGLGFDSAGGGKVELVVGRPGQTPEGLKTAS